MGFLILSLPVLPAEVNGLLDRCFWGPVISHVEGVLEAEGLYYDIVQLHSLPEN